MNSDSSQNLDQNDLKSTSLLAFLYRKRKIIIAICVLAAIVSVIASLVIQEKYKSSVVMFAASTNSVGKSFMKEDSRSDILEFGETEHAEQLLQIINSDEIKSRIIMKYDLFAHYNISPDQKGANTLMSREYNDNITSELTKFGSVQVEVLDKSPDTAMFIANDIASLVDTVGRRLKNERALQAFEMARQEYETLMREIETFEEEMKELSNKGVYDYMTQIEGLNEQYGAAVAAGRMKEAQQIEDKMSEISQYGSQYMRLESLLESAYEREAVLKQNYDLIRMDVMSTLPTKFVVNKAQVSDKKAYPIRWLIVVMSVASAFVFTVVILLVVENLKSLKTEGRI